MPILLEPKQRYAVVLDSDKDAPKDKQVVFWAFALSARQAIELVKEVEEETVKTEDVFDFLDRYIDSVDNLPEGKDLLDILTINEAWELLRKIRNNDHLDHEQKKTSE